MISKTLQQLILDSEIFRNSANDTDDGLGR
jgi:hypothetical protein